ncbi:MAG: UDP-N-acetylmuramoylalanine--D-glutamate ligase [Bacillota bacterium]|nr:MAG: UDP-N-acetylmuramoylalanine--D-glutamate ligase [Bacillota bacterium]MBS3949165.1 UDP-N-acetylmuramoyl-L-alanine--D-glutamate ligase [Peptococcaceae bacterium]
MPITLESLKGKKAAVMGIGLRSGVPLVKFLLRHGAAVTAFDKKTAEHLDDVFKALKGLNVEFILGGDYLTKLHGFDLLFKTPIMRPDLPELQDAILEGAVLTSEIELVFDLAAAPITGITGSDGKTTTTSLVNAILTHSGRRTYLGGNIGQSLIEQVEHIPVDASVVLELSSFQLMPMQQSPHVSVITNLSPNHLDVHTSYQEYVHAKANIWRYQSAGDYIILNFDDELTKAMATRVPSQAVFFSRRSEVPVGVFLQADSLIARYNGKDEVICSVNELHLRGVHNWENVAAAAAACLVQGVSVKEIAEAVVSFTTVEHRLEFVREKDGVKYYNDSIASSPTRTIAGLQAVGGDLVLIAGGSDKNTPFDELALEIVDRVRAVALIGKTADKIALAIENAEKQRNQIVNKCYLPTLEAAVNWCREQSKSGSSVMLSPACASFDMFRDFEDRGNQYKAIVRAL